MTYDNDRQLLPIGEFARATGLTTSALRFYADTGVLDPADTDPFSGYRLYAPSQISAGIRIRRLRAASMPLSGVRDVLSSSPEDAAEVIRRHITDLRASTGDAIAAAEQITDELTGDRQPAAPPAASSPTFTLAGPVLAAGLDSVLPTTVNEPELPVLGTVLVEVTDGEMRLVATDRYRLAVRTFTLPGVTGGDWSGALSAGALTAALPVWRRADQVTLHCAPEHLHAVVAGDTPPRFLFSPGISPTTGSCSMPSPSRSPASPSTPPLSDGQWRTPDPASPSPRVRVRCRLGTPYRMQASPTPRPVRSSP